MLFTNKLVTPCSRAFLHIVTILSAISSGTACLLSEESYVLCFPDDLAAELQACDLIGDYDQEEPGVIEATIDLSRLYQHDETPQFINYGVDGSASGLVYGGRGESCQKLITQNRECVTIHPMVSMAGILKYLWMK